MAHTIATVVVVVLAILIRIRQRRDRGDGAISGILGGPGRVPQGCTVSGAVQENDAAVCGTAVCCTAEALVRVRVSLFSFE